METNIETCIVFQLIGFLQICYMTSEVKEKKNL